MSRNNEPAASRHRLSTPPHTTNHVDSLHNSPPSSCVSSDMSPKQNKDEPASRGSSSSPESASSVMQLVGCPRCLMYVMMLSEEDQRCPKCKSTVLLTIVKDDT